MTDQQRLACYDEFFKNGANHKFWNYLNEFNQLSIEFVDMYKDETAVFGQDGVERPLIPTKYWKTQARKLIKKELDSKFAHHFVDYIHWETASKEMTKLRQVNEPLIREYDKYWDWTQLSKARLSEDLIEDYSRRVNWTEVSMHSILSEEFMADHVKDIDWDKISEWQRHLSEDFIRKYAAKVNWKQISQNQKLSERFMREFADVIDWFYVSKSQKLSEKFMHEFKDLLNWGRLCRYQPMSEAFLRAHKDQEGFNWNNVFTYQKTSDAFKEEFTQFWTPYEDKLKKKGKGVRAMRRKMAAKAIVEDEFRKERGFETQSENFKYSKRPSGKPILRNEQQLREERSIVHRSSGRTWVNEGDRYSPVTRPTFAKPLQEQQKKKF